MTIQQFLGRLRELDIKLWVEGEKLRYSAPAGAITDDLLSELASRKQEVIDWLNSAVTSEHKVVPDIKPVSRNQDLPPSYSQERLLFIQQLMPDTNSYNVPLAVKLKGKLDIEALERSLNEIVARHESLRTRFTTKHGRHIQAIEQQQHIKIITVAITDYEEAMRQVETEKMLPFNLATGPLLRCKLFKRAEQEHILVLTMHHIVCDAWSIGILIKELSTLYAGYTQDSPATLPELQVQYADYAVWQRETLSGDLLEKHLGYWRDTLAELTTLQLPLDHPRPAVQTFHGSLIYKELSSDLSQKIRAFSEREKTTLFMTLLSAFTVLLHRYTGQDDIVVGTPIANRNRVEVEDLIGFFINMLVLRTDVSGAPSFRELLSRVKTGTLEAYQHQELPFEKLVSELRSERDMSRNPIFQVAFALQNAPLSPVKLEGLTIEPMPMSEGTTRFDLEVNLWESEHGIAVICNYNSDLFEQKTIDSLLTHYQQMLGRIIADPDQSIDKIQLVLNDERDRLLQQWNKTDTEYPKNSTVQELFEAQVQKAPERVAFEFEGQEYSYKELNTRANQLAHYLRSHGVGPDVMVGICMERSLEMLVGLIGIIKAGGTYVPLDTDYPAQRIAFMIDDADIKLLLTSSTLSQGLPEFSGEIISVDLDWSAIAQESTENPHSAVNAENLIYVIYTSGSTGKPKGVLVPHRAVNRLVCNTDYLQVLPDDRMALASNISFDAATFEVWGALLNGAQLCSVDKATVLNPETYSRFIQEKKITVLFLTTALFNLIARQEPGAFRQLRGLLFGGEAVDPQWVKRVLEAGPPERLLHVYGPTENTTFSSWYQVNDVPADATTVPIGRPIANTCSYVLDRYMNPVPVGVTGELYVGGDGLAHGYLNRPELTAERFVPDPFRENPAAMLYRTGDLVRYRADGSIEFVGRLDHQVKIRGFRIEPGEIESILCRQPGVETAAVLARADDSQTKRLVAYIVFNDAEKTGIDEIRTALEEELPTYMVPSAFIPLDRLPLTPNGKLDRDALPLPDVEHMARESYVAPRSELETGIAETWCALLGVEKVGTRDNFFDLGGHSLLMSQVQAQLNERFSRNIPMLDLFQYPTIESLALHLGGAGEQSEALEKARARVDKRGSANDDESIAIISMAGRFPGAPSVEQFWENLANGVESIRFFTDEELTAAGISADLIEDERYVPAKGFLDDADLFDAGFFGYPPREAELIDPQQRLFLECAWEALERAAYDPARYQGLIGVYAGSSTNRYQYNLYSHPELVSVGGGMQVFISSDKDFLPTRVSYKLNLHGPSVTIQTACSTSLVAIHEACNSLLENECDIALAGGASVMVPRVQGYMYQDESIMSPDGHCRAFSNDAKGTVAGEGVGIVVLKRLSEAVQDGDIIHAVIRGSAINNDGSNKVGYTAPSVDGQAEVIAMAHAAAGVSPDSISYIETHGTGTTLGDPIEVAALTRAFDSGSDEHDSCCAIGAVKTNIGHLDAAAGVTGVIKVALALSNSQIPPSLNFNEANSEIDFSSGPFFVNTEFKSWETHNGAPRRAGVSSFGIGGTNAHAVLEQPPPVVPSDPGREWQCLPLSANNEEALQSSINRLHHYLEQHLDANLADVSYTLRTGRGQFDYRHAVICNDSQSALAALKDELRNRSWSCSDASNAPPVVFMFPGQGAQHTHMGRDLYQTETVFREIVDYCCEQLKPHINIDLRDLVFTSDTNDTDLIDQQLRQTLLAQCSLFVIEYALARLWMSWGIQPAAMIGHSIGEYVAACVSGAINLDETLLLIATRGQAMEQAPQGAMLAIPLPEKEVTGYLKQDLWLSVINGHGTCVISGTLEAIDDLQQHLQDYGIDATRLHTSGAFHSGLMDEVVPQLVQSAARMHINSPDIPYISNVTATWISESELEDPAYWGRHLRNTVRFAEGIDVLLDEFKHGVFVEVGPGNTLGSLLRQAVTDRRTGAEIISTLRHPREHLSDGETITRALARLWIQGVDIDWHSYDQHGRRNRVELPTYPFQRQRFWVDAATAPVSDHNIATARQPMQNWFYMPSWKKSMPMKNRAISRLNGRWLLFCDNTGLSEKIHQWLQDNAAETIRVFAGANYEQHENGDYTIEPGNDDDFRLLVDNLQQVNRLPSHIVHLWSVTSGADGETGSTVFSNDPVAMCYHSLIYLAQALGRSGYADAVDISIISNGVHDVLAGDRLYPEKATLLGPCAVISQEYPNISCKNIDIEVPHSGHGVETLIAEILNPADDSIIAYRGAQRWLKCYEPVVLDTVDNEDLPIRKGGVYLITGGLGGVGLAIAEFFAREFQARLVLTGRTEIPPREQWNSLLANDNGDTDATIERIKAVMALEAMGSRVLTFKADVTDRNRMQEILQLVQKELGNINGAIHSAGVAGGRAIQFQSKEIASTVMSPKIEGTRVLGELLRSIEPDFIVLCSSLASVLGIAGQVDYCSANAFQDAYADHYSEQTQIPVLAINWDTWNESGMAVNTRYEMGGDITDLSEQGHNNTEAIEAFKRILAGSSVPQIAISTYELTQRKSQIAKPARTGADVAHTADTVESPTPAKSQYQRPKLRTTYAEPSSDVEHTICDLWQELLGIDSIGIDDDFFELGGHSLLATQIIARLRTVMSVELSLESIFEAPTVRQLATLVESQQSATETVDQAALLAQQIKQMTPEQREQWLAEARRGKG